MPDLIEKTYRIARRRYQAAGVNAEGALRTLGKVRLSLNCWQGDDVQGFEMNRGLSWSGGIQATGGHPGRARNAFELRRDLARALKLIPGRHRVNLHAMYGEFGAKEVDRDGIKREHFAGWIDWAREHKLALDFNATLFNHPKAAGFTLSSKQRLVRDFWIEHVKRSRSIAAHIGRRLRQPCVCNLWIPDGMKDHCADRRGFRRILTDSLDEIYRVRYSTRMLKDSLEPKLFGIGAESCTVGSFEFYLGYALRRGLMMCLDLGHFHPTESVADKIPSLLLYFDELMLHVSRGVRWDSDHVPLFDDEVREVASEIVRCRALDRVHLALDFFDASIDRVAAWVIGARAVLKAVLYALLEPTPRLVELERKGDYTGRLAMLESMKTMPFGSVWDHYCRMNDVPADSQITGALN